MVFIDDDQDDLKLAGLAVLIALDKRCTEDMWFLVIFYKGFVDIQVRY